MEETIEKPGLFTWLSNRLGRHEEEEITMDGELEQPRGTSLRNNHQFKYRVTVRRTIVAFQDALAAADGLKREEAQILNLGQAAPELREKIKDFICGCQYVLDAHFEELGENVYLLAPACANVEISEQVSPKAVHDGNIRRI
ncbi:MAG: cell division protein SepF [Armatimonadota bacterium]